MLSSNGILAVPVSAINALSTEMRANCGSAGARVTLNVYKTATGRTDNRAPKRFNHALAHKRKVLSIGDDPALLGTRQMVLESAGFVVCSISSAGIIEEAKVNLADLALICHSVEQARASAVAKNLREINPKISILQLCKGYGGILTDLEQIPSDGPEHMLQEIEQVLQRKYDMDESTSQVVQNSATIEW